MILADASYMPFSLKLFVAACASQGCLYEVMVLVCVVSLMNIQTIPYGYRMHKINPTSTLHIITSNACDPSFHLVLFQHCYNGEDDPGRCKGSRITQTQEQPNT